jgi:hypothetical protein
MEMILVVASIAAKQRHRGHAHRNNHSPDDSGLMRTSRIHHSVPNCSALGRSLLGSLRGRERSKPAQSSIVASPTTFAMSTDSYNKRFDPEVDLDKQVLFWHVAAAQLRREPVCKAGRR